MSTSLLDSPSARLVGLSDRAGTRRVFAAMAAALFMASMDQTVVSAALPTIMSDLGGTGEVSLAVTAYLLPEMIAMIAAGRLGDLYGRWLIFLLGCVIFGVGSLIALAAPTLSLLIVGRAVEGLGAGALMVTVMALVADLYPADARGRVLAWLGSLFAVATIAGPLVGGAFAEYASWRIGFGLNVVLVVIVFSVARRNLPRPRRSVGVRGGIDLVGIIAVATATSAAVLALVTAGAGYPLPLFLGLVAVCATVGFVIVERQVATPTLPLSLFRLRAFSVSMVLSFVIGFAMLGALTFLPVFLQVATGVGPTESGLQTIPLVVGMVGAGALSGLAAARGTSYRVFPVAGMAILAIGFFMMSGFGPGSGLVPIAAVFGLVGVALGLSNQVLTMAVQVVVPVSEMGAATAALSFFRSLGGVLGTTVFGALYVHLLDPGLAEFADRFGSLSAGDARDLTGLGALGPSAELAIRAIYSDAVTQVFSWVVPVAVVGLLAAALLPRLDLSSSTAD